MRCPKSTLEAYFFHRFLAKAEKLLCSSDPKIQEVGCDGHTVLFLEGFRQVVFVDVEMRG